MDFVEEVDWFIFAGIVEGKDVWTLINLLRSHLEGLINAEEMMLEIDSFTSEFYKRKMQGAEFLSFEDESLAE